METEMYWQDNCSLLSERVKHIFHEKLFTDLEIIVKDNDDVQVFSAHKLFLASSSPYFESALFGPLCSKTDQITLDGIDFGAFECLLSFIYTDVILPQTINRAISVYRLADRFLMENLKSMCVKYIEKNLDAKNVCQVLENFRMYNDDHIISVCMNIVSCDTASIIASKDFENISKETLLLILDEDVLGIKSEAQLYKAAERWIEAEIIRKGISDDAVKKELFYDVMENIRFKSISPDEFPHSHLMAKFLNSEDKKKILKSISGSDSSDSLPGGFSQKTRELVFYPSKNLADNYPLSLPPDWKNRLHASVVKGDIKSLKRLVEAGADVKVKYYNGSTLLHVAAHRFKLSVVNFLVDQGLPVNTIDGRGYTALHIAALWGKFDIIQLLLQKGADPTINNIEGQTPLDIANAQCHTSHREIRGLLMSWL